MRAPILLIRKEHHQNIEGIERHMEADRGP
jgi:hypothetical protein